MKEVVRENASERGWGLVGPPEITFETERYLVVPQAAILTLARD